MLSYFLLIQPQDYLSIQSFETVTEKEGSPVLKFAMEGRKKEQNHYDIVSGKLQGRHYSDLIKVNDIKQTLHFFRKINYDQTSKDYLKIKSSNSSRDTFKHKLL